MHANGWMPCASAFSRLITTTAAAPSFKPGALPAVTRPSGLKTGLSFARASSDVSQRRLAARRLARSGGDHLADHRFLDRGRIDPGALDGGADGDCAKLRCREWRQRAAEFSDGRARRADDDRITRVFGVVPIHARLLISGAYIVPCLPSRINDNWHDLGVTHGRLVIKRRARFHTRRKSAAMESRPTSGLTCFACTRRLTHIDSAIWLHYNRQRLAKPLMVLHREPLSAEAVRAAIADVPFIREVVYLPATGSTNDVAHRLASQGAPHATLIVTDDQTAGRGRIGRAWYMPPRAALAMSLLVRPDLAARHANRLTMLASLAAAEGVERATGLAVRLKWPNDVVVEIGDWRLEVGGRAAGHTSGVKKVGGILTETSIL